MLSKLVETLQELRARVVLKWQGLGASVKLIDNLGGGSGSELVTVVQIPPEL